ncbi:hypothetical protein Salat_0621500 [Sesamum alatum]|uniref:GRF-type domain-containing protein n=1 Tax=Sesamum alatum TaxID=300844 RepID=A0AAE1YR29_9LAMI|nr:hypothetical protein Salat_0621500 [Sesamum alatum]
MVAKWNFNSNEYKQRLDLRFSNTPFCLCNVKAEIRTVESQRKPSKGKLYYCCRFQSCNFFRWIEPERATWVPSGIPVNFHGHGNDEFCHGFEEYCDSRHVDEEFDVDDVVSRVTKNGGSVDV